MGILPQLSQAMHTLLTTTEAAAADLQFEKRPDRANTQRVPVPQHLGANPGVWLAGPADGDR